jgi:hypothetical protein
MAFTEQHVLERGYQPLRGPARIAPLIRAEMDDRGLTAKELALLMKAWAADDPRNRWALDFRTIQHAMAGTACALDTYLALSGFFGWDFTENVQTPIHGADPMTARERQLEARLAQASALHERIERERALRTAAAPLLALVERRSAVQGSRAGG